MLDAFYHQNGAALASLSQDTLDVRHRRECLHDYTKASNHCSRATGCGSVSLRWASLFSPADR
jgi:hypothetical protein